MNNYELALVVSAKIEEEARATVVEKIKERIVKYGGSITNVGDQGKKKLAYDINKESEGFYTFISFDSESNVPAELDRKLRINENVLRYLCVRRDA